MITNFDKEEFLKSIHTIPFWVKNGDDLLKFCRHLHYRLLQEKAVNAWYATNVILEDRNFEVNLIHNSYDQAYMQDDSKFLPFEEFLVARKH